MAERAPRLRTIFRLIPPAFALSAVGATCDKFIPLESSTVLGRLKEVKVLVGAYELGAACELQESASEKMPEREAEWRPVPRNQFFRRELTVEDRKPYALRVSQKDVVYATLRVSEARTGKRFWLRNAPALSSAQSQERWKCLVGIDEASASMPKLAAKHVQLATKAWECTDVSPIFGGKADVGFFPYTTNQRTLVVTTTGKFYVAVRLEREGTDQALTVPGAVLDRCFTEAPAPEAAEDAKDNNKDKDKDKAKAGADASALYAWLTGPTPDAVAPPPASDALVERLTGVDPRTCPKWGPGAMPTYACRVPVVRLMTLAEAGPFGPPRVRLLRERLVDGLYVRGGRLVAPADAPAVNMVVRAKGAPTPGFARTFAAELGKNEPERIRRRLLSGARLLRATDVTKGMPATHAIDVEVSFTLPPVETSTEVWTHKYVAGKKEVPNPKRAEAEAALFDAKAAAESANLEVVMAERMSADAEAVCGKADKDDKASAATNPTCGGAQWSWAASAITARKAAQARVKDAEAALAATPATREVDDERAFDLSTKVMRRRGDAVFHLTVTSEARGSKVELDTTASVGFDVVDAELPSDPEHKMTARAARAPSAEEVDRKVATILIARLEDLMMKWDAQAQTQGDIGDLAPGSRSWLTAVARQATNGRDVLLLGDLQERRADVLGLEAITYGVTIAEEARKACYAFAASAQAASAPRDVNLLFGKNSPTGVLPIASDVRASPDAAVEVCNLAPGDYSITVTSGHAQTTEAPRALVVSMYASTPGRVTSAETLAATRGLPYVTKAGEALRFTSGGLARVAADGAVAPVSPNGDRDGDGIPDEADQCPDAAETRNGHLDQDGCPDEAPAKPAASSQPGVVEGGEL